MLPPLPAEPPEPTRSPHYPGANEPQMNAPRRRAPARRGRRAGVRFLDGPGRREHQRQTKISHTLATPNSHAPAAASSHGVVSLAISDIGERCEAEGISDDDRDSVHGSGQFNSMHLPIDDTAGPNQTRLDPPASFLLTKH